MIVFTVTNTSKDDSGHGAWFKASDLKLEDHTIVGDGEVKDLKYPDNWSTLVLKPGDSVEVTGTLTGFTKDRHTDRAKVTGTPLVECPVVDKDPFGDASGKPSTGGEGRRRSQAGDRRRSHAVRGHASRVQHRRLERPPVAAGRDRFRDPAARRGRAAHGRPRRRRRDGPPPQVGA